MTPETPFCLIEIEIFLIDKKITMSLMLDTNANIK